MCISPVTLWRKHATIDGRKTDIVPCGKCHECLASRRNAWSFRLFHEMQNANSACFVTLTYGVNEKEGFGKDPPLSSNGLYTLDKTDFQLFMKRLRKKQKRYYGRYGEQQADYRPLKYYVVGEYGTNFQRPHYHVILYNLCSYLMDRSLKVSKEIWQHGNVDIARSNIASINYVVSYCMKGTWKPECDMDDRQPEYANQSNGLGITYLTPNIWEMHVDRLDATVTHPSGFKIPMPRYYKQKIFSKEERKELEEIYQQMNHYNWDDLVNMDYKLVHTRLNREILKHERNLKQKRAVL